MKKMLLCRICLRQTAKSNSIKIGNDSKSLEIKQQLSVCVPEMVLDMVANPVVCYVCMGALHSLSTFKELCLRTDAYIRSYMEKNNITDACDIVEMHVHNKQLNHSTKQKDNTGLATLLKKQTLKRPKAVSNINGHISKKRKIEESRSSVTNDSETATLIPRPDEETNTSDSENVCNVCHYKFLLKLYLTKHMKLHKAIKRKTDEVSYIHDHISKKQKIIDNQYRVTNDLESAILKTVPREETNISDLVNVCNICQYKFVLKLYLIKHMKLHKATRHFNCEKCNFQTLLLPILINHRLECRVEKALLST